jgi:hypothetical protein
LVLKHGGKLPKGLKATDENVYLFRTSLARRSSSSSSPSPSSSSNEDEIASEDKEEEEKLEGTHVEEEVRETPNAMSPETIPSPPMLENLIEQEIEAAEGDVSHLVPSSLCFKYL